MYVYIYIYIHRISITARALSNCNPNAMPLAPPRVHSPPFLYSQEIHYGAECYMDLDEQLGNSGRRLQNMRPCNGAGATNNTYHLNVNYDDIHTHHGTQIEPPIYGAPIHGLHLSRYRPRPP